MVSQFWAHVANGANLLTRQAKHQFHRTLYRLVLGWRDEEHARRLALGVCNGRHRYDSGGKDEAVREVNKCQYSYKVLNLTHFYLSLIPKTHITQGSLEMKDRLVFDSTTLLLKALQTVSDINRCSAK